MRMRKERSSLLPLATAGTASSLVFQVMHHACTSKPQLRSPSLLTTILGANSAIAIAIEPSLGALAAGLEVTAQYILVCSLQAQAGTK